MTKTAVCQRKAIDIRKNITNTAAYRNKSNIGKRISLLNIDNYCSDIEFYSMVNQISKSWSDYYQIISELKYDMFFVESHVVFLKFNPKWKAVYDSVNESYSKLCNMQQNNIGSISDYIKEAKEMLLKIVLVRRKIISSYIEFGSSIAILLYIAFAFVMFFFVG